MGKILKFLIFSVLLSVSAAAAYFFFSKNDSLLPEERPQEQFREIELYYYNQARDAELDPNIGCSRDAVLPVKRTVERTITPVQDAVKLLLEGKITEEEKGMGFSTEFPLEGFYLKGADLEGGVLTLEFGDDSNKSGGGSCRVGILWAQIEKTASQFDGVSSVRFEPDTLFQP